MSDRTPIVMLDPSGTPGQVPRISDDGTVVEYADAASGAVESVNGDPGPAVVLDAADVGARASTWVPAWTDVTDKPATFTPTAHTHPWADITGAPADAAAGTASLRTLGTGVTQAAAGNDARLSDARTPLAHVHAAADVTYAGSVNLAATNVEAALDELDTEKPTWETSQRVVYVATTGNNTTGDGTSGNPWLTIQHAVNQAKNIMQPTNGVSGYKILLSPGTYIGSTIIPPNVLGAVDTVGNGGIIVQSTTSALADVIIRANSGPAILAYGSFSLRYLTLEADGTGVQLRGGGHVQGFVRDCKVRRTSLSNGDSSTQAFISEFARLYVRDTAGETGRLFGYGLVAATGATIAKAGTVPGGAVAAELLATGGAIR